MANALSSQKLCHLQSCSANINDDRISILDQLRRLLSYYDFLFIVLDFSICIVGLYPTRHIKNCTAMYSAYNPFLLKLLQISAYRLHRNLKLLCKLIRLNYSVFCH